MTDLKSATISQQSQDWFKAIIEAKESFPLSLDQIKQATALQHNSWEHPLVLISQALLDHYKIIDDPFMLTSLEEEGRDKSVGCHCFYATVSFNALGVFVFDNWGEGNMCKEIPENLRAVLPYPDWLTPHMDHFRSLVREMQSTQVACEHFEQPRKGYLWPELEQVHRKPIRIPAQPESGISL